MRLHKLNSVRTSFNDNIIVFENCSKFLQSCGKKITMNFHYPYFMGLSFVYVLRVCVCGVWCVCAKLKKCSILLCIHYINGAPYSFFVAYYRCFGIFKISNYHKEFEDIRYTCLVQQQQKMMKNEAKEKTKTSNRVPLEMKRNCIMLCMCVVHLFFGVTNQFSGIIRV